MRPVAGAELEVPIIYDLFPPPPTFPDSHLIVVDIEIESSVLNIIKYDELITNSRVAT